MSTFESTYQMDRTTFDISTLDTPSDEKAYWLQQTPSERLRALEFMRQVMYGYDPASTRLQRVFAVAERSSS